MPSPRILASVAPLPWPLRHERAPSSNALIRQPAAWPWSPPQLVVPSSSRPGLNPL